MSLIEAEYQSRMDALTGKERVARSLTLLKWTREMIARQIIAEQGTIPEDQLNWEVALRLYRGDPKARTIIESRLGDVSR